MKIKIITIITCMLLIYTVLPSSSNVIIDRNSYSTIFGNTLFVGGSGPGNYTSIQDAINDSSAGDTVFVFNGIYYEKIFIYKEIRLIGEDKNKTTLDGRNVIQDKGLVNVLSNSVNISGFTIYKAFTGILIQDVNDVTIFNNNIMDSPFYSNGIDIKNSSHIYITNNCINNNREAGVYIFNSDNILINGNKISNNYDGLLLKNITDCFLQNNIISNNGGFGIWCREYCNYCNISDNIINESEFDGIHLDSSNNNIINRNYLMGNLNGIHISGSQNNIILMNNIERNRERGIRLSSKNCEVMMNNIIDNQVEGLYLQNCVYIIIKKNNFINNNPNAFFDYTTYSFSEILSLFKNSRTNTFEGNYWDRIRLLPVKIKGTIRVYFEGNPWMPPVVLSCSKFDFFPARQPYCIES